MSQARKVSTSRVALKPVYCTLSAWPPAASSWMIGPLLRRGTISVAGGICPPAGTTVTSSDWPEVGLFWRNTSGIACTGSSLPWNTVASPLGEEGSGRTCSR